MQSLVFNVATEVVDGRKRSGLKIISWVRSTSLTPRTLAQYVTNLSCDFLFITLFLIDTLYTLSHPHCKVSSINLFIPVANVWSLVDLSVLLACQR